MSDTFIREVDEDLRQKQLSSLWKKYGKIVIGIAVGIVRRGCWSLALYIFC